MSRFKYVAKVCGFEQEANFEFDEEIDAPEFPRGKDAVEVLRTVVRHHDSEMFNNRKWNCVICGGPATKLVYHPVSYLTSETPQIRDLPNAVCSPACQKKETDNVHNVMFDLTGLRPGQANTNERGLACDECGRKTKLLLCSKCRRTYYCSRECQTSAWNKVHKFLCQPADEQG